MNTLAVVQARVGSSRFPGKVLADLAGRPMLAFMLERIRTLQADVVVVATTVERRDDAVVAIAEAAGVPVIRGPEADVLARFGMAMEQFPTETVMRLTADCPLLDAELANQVLSLHRERQADYTSNALVPTFPDGLDVEVVSSKALAAAVVEATDQSEREHVTTFLYRRPARFKLVVLRHVPPLDLNRWTVDTPADLETVRQAVSHFGDRIDFGWTEVLDVLGVRGDSHRLVRPLEAGDVDHVARLAVSPGTHFYGSLKNDPRGVQDVLRRSLDDPALRIWSIVEMGVSRGAFVIAVDEGVGDLSVIQDPAFGDTFRHALTGLQDALRAGQQIATVTAECVPAVAVDTFRSAGFRKHETDDALAWRVH